jgi:hypothetical protein
MYRNISTDLASYEASIARKDHEINRGFNSFAVYRSLFVQMNYPVFVVQVLRARHEVLQSSSFVAASIGTSEMARDDTKINS